MIHEWALESSEASLEASESLVIGMIYANSLTVTNGILVDEFTTAPI